MHDAYSGCTNTSTEVEAFRTSLGNLANLATRMSMLHHDVSPNDPEVIKIISPPKLKEPVAACELALQGSQFSFEKLELRHGRKEVWKRLKTMVKKKEINSKKEMIMHHLIALNGVQETLSA